MTNITARTFAIVNEYPDIIPNPNIPVTIATIKNIIAQYNNPDNPFFIHNINMLIILYIGMLYSIFLTRIFFHRFYKILELLILYCFVIF